MTWVVRIVAIVAAAGVLFVLAGVAWYSWIANPRVARELAEEPDGDRARKVMLIRLPSGRELPVNYLREGDVVYAGADGRWWKELEGEGFDVEVLIRGERLRGRGRAVLDDPDHRTDVFSRLRPNALPGFGTLVEIRLASPET